MAATHPDRLLTIDDLQHLPDDGYQYELVKGKLVRMPPSVYLSGFVASRLAFFLIQFIVEHGLGYYAGPDTGVITGHNPDTVRAPDFSFISKARMPGGKLSRRLYPPSPDLAVEVLGETDRISKTTAKALEYLAAGSRLVWIIDPFDRSALIFRPERPPEVLSGVASLSGEDVLPGLSLPLAHLWEGLNGDEDERG